MSNDKFHIVAQRERCLLHITMRDQWTVETVAAYKAALLPEIERLVMGGCKPGSIVSLMDARQRGPQSQEVIAAFQEQLGGKLSPRRLAILVSSALFERQVQRIDIPNQRMFTDEDEATAWLLSPDEPA